MDKMDGVETTVVFSLGSNLGNRLDFLKEASRRLEACGKIQKASSIVESKSWGYEDSSPYLNAVIKINTNWNPEELYELISKIEHDLGRERDDSDGYSARKIDIDILYYGNRHISTENLEIPHPRLHIRNFVLLPLAEIAPSFIHPILKKTSTDLLKESPDEGLVTYFSDLCDKKL
ncbi:MAG: 2-amino-4-hydroxy-6-hydroxymethyldihydropteridine diphosphokinase [Cryomorphaceae bacterium]